MPKRQRKLTDYFQTTVGGGGGTTTAASDSRRKDSAEAAIVPDAAPVSSSGILTSGPSLTSCQSQRQRQRSNNRVQRKKKKKTKRSKRPPPRYPIQTRMAKEYDDHVYAGTVVDIVFTKLTHRYEEDADYCSEDDVKRRSTCTSSGSKPVYLYKVLFDDEDTAEFEEYEVKAGVALYRRLQEEQPKTLTLQKSPVKTEEEEKEGLDIPDSSFAPTTCPTAGHSYNFDHVARAGPHVETMPTTMTPTCTKPAHTVCTQEEEELDLSNGENGSVDGGKNRDHITGRTAAMALPHRPRAQFSSVVITPLKASEVPPVQDSSEDEEDYDYRHGFRRALWQQDD